MDDKGFFAKLFNRKKTEHRNLQQRCRDAAALVLDGKPPKDAELDALLAEMGWSAEDFQREVEKLARRRHLVGQIGAADQAEAERSRVEALITRHNQEYNAAISAARQKNLDVTQPLLLRLKQIEAVIAPRCAAINELETTADRPDVREAIAALNDELAAVRKERDEHKVVAGQAASAAVEHWEVVHAQQSFNNPALNNPALKAEHKEKADALAAVEEQHKAAADALQPKINALKARREELTRELLNV